MTQTAHSTASEYPLLILGPGTPRSARTRARLVAGAERSGIAVATLGRPDRLRALERMLASTRADALAVCADAGTQALVASVAAARNLPYACVPSGDDDLLARDLGSPRDDPLEALKVLLSSRERTVDLAEVNGSVFVNYVALGLHPLPAPAPRARTRTQPASSRAPDVRGEPSAAADGATPPLLVTNNRFEVRPEGLGERGWPDRGLLCVIVFPAGAGDPLRASGRREESQCARLELATAAPVLAEVDGEPCVLQPPLRFRSLPGALRVRVREHAPSRARQRSRGGAAGEPAGAEPPRGPEPGHGRPVARLV